MAGKQLFFDVLAVAEAKGFAGAAREVDKLSKSADKSSKSFDKQSKSAHLMSTALLSIGAAAVPVAGVAAGALIGLGAAGAVALVGILGIASAMKQGTDLGRKYQAAFKPITTEFTRLKQISAAGLFDGVNSGVKSLKPLFPVLNSDVALFSSQLGKIAGNVAPGLVALFTRLNPLFATIGDQLVHGSQGFEDWAKSSQAVGRFVAYVQTTLPQVEQTVGSLITTISHVAIAAEPFGGATLTAVRLFSMAINSIPIGVLQTVVPLLLGLKVGASLSAGLSNAATGLQKFASKAEEAGGVASGAAGAAGKLGGVVSKLGPVGVLAGVALGGLSLIMGNHSAAAQKAQQSENDFTQALQASNGAIDENIRKIAAKHLQDSGAFDDAKKLGLSTSNLTDAVLDQGKAQQIINDLNKRFPDSAASTIKASGLTTKEYNKQFVAAGNITHALTGQNDALSKAKTKNNELAAASKDLTTSQESLAQRLHLTVDQASKYAAILGQTTVGTAAWANAVKTVAAAENSASVTGSAFLDQLGTFAQSTGTAADRANILKATLKAAAGDTLSFQTTINGATVAEKGLGDAITQAAGAVGKNGESTKAYLDSIINLKTGTIDYKNSAATPLLSSLGQIQDAALNSAGAIYQHNRALGVDGKRSADIAYQTYVSQTGPMLEKQLTSLGLNKDAAHKLAQSYEGVPSKVKTLIEQEGANPIVTVLNKIGQQLAFLTGHPWVTKADADTTPAKSKIGDLQAKINAIRQQRVPGIDANSNAAKQQIARLQAQIDALHGKTIQITVAQQQAGLQSQRARADGGPVRKGVSYLVGEKRPEIFTPEANGYITPRVPSSSSGTAGGSTRMHVVGGQVALTADSQGRLFAQFQDLILDQAQFAATTGRMG